ncbi:MAG: hypothetical protein A3A97_02830 [Candidatus Terrybacteria bacterium RIFCSPLOWO2_01_FULL_40_23]|uniref:Uncharacterized protein n=1 Tax=Candidatus Terrybacteria bacterium RIFCSPLOWO2_01_FULL_40_23 TaxID=1802366 RepID=A0A1G2PUC2_9BACT|nr:MAG: hypothetical protein A3A97_02830 [Candidatus Terrybacteria bacterium RIFCSPLOWO2_01_FULL_40_23]
MITISTDQIIISTVLLFVLFSVAQFLIATWIKARLEKSIQHEYDKKSIDYNFSILQREQAVKIAALLAKWIKYGEDSTEVLSENERRNYFEELNKMTLELAIWIPDEEIVKKLMACLSHNETAPNIREIVTDVRALVRNKNNYDLTWQDIVVFSIRNS